MSAETGRGIEMYMAKYLLSIEEFMEKEKGEALLDRAFSCVDETRREKAERLKPGRARAACLGAGLLLQLAAGEALGKVGSEAENAELSGIKKYSVSRLLCRVEKMPRLSLTYTYGEKGKPYFRDCPFYFSLSHSGHYVLCSLAAEEIGADIQQHCGTDVRKLARRFFPQREAAAIEKAGEERERLFYRLWARKEAYGKLTGSGVADVMDVDLLPEIGGMAENGGGSGSAHVLPGMTLSDRGVLLSETALPDGRRLILEECDAEGYSIAFCRYG